MQISLKAARVNREITQAELAEKMGVSTAQISQWEKGINDMPTKQFFKFCEILNISRDDIFLPSYFRESKS